MGHIYKKPAVSPAGPSRLPALPPVDKTSHCSLGRLARVGTVLGSSLFVVMLEHAAAHWRSSQKMEGPVYANLSFLDASLVVAERIRSVEALDAQRQMNTYFGGLRHMALEEGGILSPFKGLDLASIPVTCADPSVSLKNSGVVRFTEDRYSSLTSESLEQGQAPHDHRWIYYNNTGCIEITRETGSPYVQRMRVSQWDGYDYTPLYQQVCDSQGSLVQESVYITGADKDIKELTLEYYAGVIYEHVTLHVSHDGECTSAMTQEREVQSWCARLPKLCDKEGNSPHSSLSGQEWAQRLPQIKRVHEQIRSQKKYRSVHPYAVLLALKQEGFPAGALRLVKLNDISGSQGEQIVLGIPVQDEGRIEFMIISVDLQEILPLDIFLDYNENLELYGVQDKGGMTFHLARCGDEDLSAYILV